MKILFSLLAFSLITVCAKSQQPTADTQRLVKRAEMVGTWEKEVLYCKWSGTRATVHSPNPMDIFHTGVILEPFEPVLPYTSTTEAFATDKHGRYLNQPVDSLYSAFWNSVDYENRYGFNGKVLLYTNYGGIGPFLSYNFVYNQVGQISEVFSSIPYGPHMYCMYDSNGWLIKDSIVFFNSTVLRDYLKDGNGRDTAYREYDDKGDVRKHVVYDYLPDGRLNAATRYSEDGLKVGVDSFGYTGNNTYPSFHISGTVKSTGQIDGSKVYRTLSSNGDVSGYVQLFYNGTSWDSTARYNCTWNSANNPDILVTELYYGPNWYSKTTFKFTYENFLSGSTEVLKPSLNIWVYPNPVTSALTIVVDNVSVGTVSILDLSGSIKKMQQCRGDKSIINTSDLPSGNYILKYQSKDGEGSTVFRKE